MDGLVTLNTALEQVNTALRGNNPAEALNSTAELLVAYPESVRAWRARASALETTGQFSAAAEALGRVLDIVPSDALALVAHARMLNAAGRAAEAAEAARLALDYDPDNSQLRKFAQQEPHTQGVPIGSPHTGRVHMARNQYHNGLTNRAITKLHNLLQSYPTRVDTHVELADMLWRSSIRHTAAEMCRKILESHPQCLTANAILTAYNRRMKNASAEQQHLALIALVDPDHRETYGLLADRSPVRIIDVPVQNSSARPILEEDEESRSDWVDQLIASSSVAPVPTGRPVPASNIDSDVTRPSVLFTPDERESTAVHELPPLDWSTVNASDEDALDVETLTDTAFDRAEQLPEATLPPALEISDSRLVTEEGIAVEPLDWSPTADDADLHIQIENTLEHDIDASEVAKNSDEPQPDLDPEYADDSESERSSPATAPAFVAHGNRMIRVDTMKQPQPASRIASRAKPEDMLAAARDSLARTSLVEAAGYYEQLAAKNKRLEEVIADLETAIQVHPASQRLYEALGMAYTNKGNIPAALDAYRKALASIG